MYVCVCRGVSLKVVQDAIVAGADSVEKVERCTRAGSSCGACRDEIQELVDEHHGCAGCPRLADAA